MLEKYISLKQGVRCNTKVGYQFVLNLVRKEDFGYRKINKMCIRDRYPAGISPSTKIVQLRVLENIFRLVLS